MQLQDDGSGEVFPVVEIESKNTVPKPRDPNEKVFTYSSIDEARAHGLSLGSSFKTKTSKTDTNWRYSCRELKCPARWSIVEKKYINGSSSFLLRVNQSHTHISDVKDEHIQDGDVLVKVEEGQEYFSCNFSGCSFKAKSIRALKGHRDIHKEKETNKAWVCRWCDYTTTASQYKLTQHVNSVHLNFKPFKCDLCDYAAMTRKEVTYHVQRYHKKENFNKHQCDQCGYSAQERGDQIQFLTYTFFCLIKKLRYRCVSILYTVSSEDKIV